MARVAVIRAAIVAVVMMVIVAVVVITIGDGIADDSGGDSTYCGGTRID
jgi:hypothetical protein